MGRHAITGATQAQAGIWTIAVAGTPWQATDTELGLGVDGIEVDLDASETLSSLYTIETNTESSITITTADDLSGVVGNELVGVHTFETVTATNGASFGFNNDNVVSIQ